MTIGRTNLSLGLVHASETFFLSLAFNDYSAFLLDIQKMYIIRVYRFNAISLFLTNPPLLLVCVLMSAYFLWFPRLTFLCLFVYKYLSPKSGNFLHFSSFPDFLSVNMFCPRDVFHISRLFSFENIVNEPS